MGDCMQKINQKIEKAEKDHPHKWETLVISELKIILSYMLENEKPEKAEWWLERLLPQVK